MRILSLLTLSLFMSSALASEIHIGVKGMVCAFCAVGIKKKFSAEPGVEKVKVDLDKKIVDLTLENGKDISDNKIADILEDAGFSVDLVQRK